MNPTARAGTPPADGSGRHTPAGIGALRRVQGMRGATACPPPTLSPLGRDKCPKAGRTIPRPAGRLSTWPQAIP